MSYNAYNLHINNKVGSMPNMRLTWCANGLEALYRGVLLGRRVNKRAR